MNYVAHLFLARPSDEHRIGSLLADFTVGTLDTLRMRYGNKIVEGIAHHRAVDRFTDTHPEVVKAVNAMTDRFGLYSSIIVDVVYDHFLLKHWSRFTDQPTDQFFNAVYQTLSRMDLDYPEKYKSAVRGMLERRWLSSYIQLESVSYALKRIGTRFSRPTPLDDTLAGLKENYQLLDETFLAFFPALISYSESIMESCGKG